MRPSAERLWELAMIAALLLLGPLGWLQYRWISEVSEADLERRREFLELSTDRLANEVERDLMRALAGLMPRGPDGMRRPPPGAHRGPGPVRAEIIKRLNERVADWRRETGDPLIRDIRVSESLDREAEPGQGTVYLFGPLIGWRGPPGERRPPPIGLEVELDLDYLRQTYFPARFNANFGDDASREYRLRVSDGVQTIYSSSAEAFTPEYVREMRQRGPRDGMRPPPRAPLSDWQLETAMAAGSLEEIAGAVRSRNLAVSAVVLILLASAIAALAWSARRARRLSRLQMEFAMGVTHELKTPIAVLCSAGENLAGGIVHDNPQVILYGEVVRENGQRLGRMVEQILRFAGLESGHMKFVKDPVSIRDLVDVAVADWKDDVVVDLPPMLPHIAGESAPLAQALRNLVENALTHGASPVSLAVSLKGEAVQITVEDSGRGIPEGDLKHAFEPFYRGKRTRENQVKGFGLGLNLAKRFTEAHGGTIALVNRPGGGLAVTMTLPRWEEN